MYSQIYGNLNRQSKGLQLLSALLEEEFAYLSERRMDDVASIEFSILELIRQLIAEREEIINIMQGVKARQYAEMLPPDEAAAMNKLLDELEENEQSCAKQSSLNSEMSLSLLDQGQQLMDFLYTRALPPQVETYNGRGSMYKQRPQAAMLSGRC